MILCRYRYSKLYVIKSFISNSDFTRRTASIDITVDIISFSSNSGDRFEDFFVASCAVALNGTGFSKRGLISKLPSSFCNSMSICFMSNKVLFIYNSASLTSVTCEVRNFANMFTFIDKNDFFPIMSESFYNVRLLIRFAANRAKTSVISFFRTSRLNSSNFAPNVTVFFCELGSTAYRADFKGCVDSVFIYVLL